MEDLSFIFIVILFIVGLWIGFGISVFLIRKTYLENKRLKDRIGILAFQKGKWVEMFMECREIVDEYQRRMKGNG